MSWLTKIFSLGSGKTENIEEQPFEQVPHDQKEESEGGLAETSLHERFPKTGKFRFPLIKDDAAPAQQKEPNQYKQKKHQKETAGGRQSANEKKAFKPTVIPSPIYGFKQRKETSLNDYYRTSISKEEERDRLSEDGPISEKRDSSLSFEKGSPQEDSKEAEKALQQILEKEEHSFEEKLVKEYSAPSKEENKTETPIQQKEELQPASDDEQDFLGTENGKSEKMREEHVHQKPSTPASSPGQKQERSNHPFNVLMLSSDKKKRAAGSGYTFPDLSLLDVPAAQRADDKSWINEQKELLNQTLKNFHVNAAVVRVTQGPSVTRYEVHPEAGVKVNKITNLADDIKLSLSARDIRIEAPIPGKNTIGIEVPNKKSKMVYIREMIRSKEFRTNESPLTAALGMDITGTPVVLDLKKMPHGLIAGSTGSGKSVCLNTILVSLLYKSEPSEVKLLLIDPKMVELAPYHEIPHLVSPVITDPKAATAALKWVVEEMERRYQLFAHSGVRDLTKFNQKVQNEQMGEKLPYLVVVIDELADLMMVAPGDVEESICRIAQKARACGIHLLIATQRPSVDVITGLIKANISTRIAFSVSSQVDSRTIIDTAGAEKLLGKGDMLFLENGSGKPVRLQGNFVSDGEIERAVSHVRKQMKPSYLFEQEELMSQTGAFEEEDELFLEACHFALEQGHASTSSLQRRFRVGYNRAARLIDMMEREGFISSANGSKPRDLLITKADFTQWVENQ